MYPRDVFLCHAHADKATHARILRDELSSRAISVWFDEGMISAGDSLVKQVGEGLARAQLVLVLITTAFLQSNWTDRELSTALALEIGSGRQRVIPVVDVPLHAVTERYPLLADKRMLEWSEGPATIADMIARPFKRRADEWFMGAHPPSYVGPVWTRVTAVEQGEHRIQIVWGRFKFDTSIELYVRCPISLTHHKTAPTPDQPYVRVDPAAIVTFGQGPPPDENAHDVDEGWTRVRGAPLDDRPHDIAPVRDERI
jgi:hypothetical protein